jgi:hypothetical protein
MSNSPNLFSFINIVIRVIRKLCVQLSTNKILTTKHIIFYIKNSSLIMIQMWHNTEPSKFDITSTG